MMFNKRGGDGTGKANIVWDPNGVVRGVIYRCSSDELDEMDPYEGVTGGHYHRSRISFFLPQQQLHLSGDEFFVVSSN